MNWNRATRVAWWRAFEWIATREMLVDAFLYGRTLRGPLTR